MKMRVVVSLVLSLVSWGALANGIECVGGGNKIDLLQSPSGRTNALFYASYGQNYELIGQYEVYAETSQFDFHGNDFDLSITKEPSYANEWTGSYQALSEVTKQSYSGKMFCLIPAIDPAPFGTPHCLGMMEPHYYDGAWHCLGGGH